VRYGLRSAFGNWKIKKLRRFENTIAPWPVPVRQSSHNLQRRGAFITAFKSEKRWMKIKNRFFRNWKFIQNFHQICHSLHDVKSKGAVGAGVRLPVAIGN
jgi:hypothetical protein